MKTLHGKRTHLEKEAARDIADTIALVLKKKKYTLLGLPGGSSVKGIFNKLKEEKVQWARVHVFMVDERRVPLDNKESNYGLIDETLLRHVLKSKRLPKRNIHPYDHTGPIEKYNQDFKKYGDRFDVALLSAGEDGHVAGLFPEHTVERDDEQFFTFDDSPKPPKKRMTASRRLLEKSKNSVLLFFGEKKQRAFKNFSDEAMTFKQCPAKIVRCNPRALVLVSEE